jgi:HEAT repeat protein
MCVVAAAVCICVILIVLETEAEKRRGAELSSDNWSEAQRAALLLGRSGSRRAIDGLKHGLKNTQYISVRMAIVEAANNDWRGEQRIRYRVLGEMPEK